MPTSLDSAAVLTRIRQLAAVPPDATPEALQAALAAIAALAGGGGGDTAEPSDTPHTENQSL